MLRLYYMDTSCFENSPLFMETYSKLSQHRKDKIDFYYFKKDRFLSMGAGFLLDFVLHSYCLEEKNSKFSYVKNGKPCLKNCPVFFNLSHSGSFAACAFSEHEIGIDIERIQIPEHALMERVCRPRELTYLRSLQGQALSSAFAKLWTIKESYMKYLGTGLTLDPLRLEIDFHEPCSLIHDGTPVQIYFKTYALPYYQLSLCSEANDFPSAPTLIKLTETHDFNQGGVKWNL